MFERVCIARICFQSSNVILGVCYTPWELVIYNCCVEPECSNGSHKILGKRDSQISDTPRGLQGLFHSTRCHVATFVTLWLQVVQPLANVHETKWTPHVKRETDVAQSYTSSDITHKNTHYISNSGGFRGKGNFVLHLSFNKFNCTLPVDW